MHLLASRPHLAPAPCLLPGISPSPGKRGTIGLALPVFAYWGPVVVVLGGGGDTGEEMEAARGLGRYRWGGRVTHPQMQ